MQNKNGLDMFLAMETLNLKKCVLRLFGEKPGDSMQTDKNLAQNDIAIDDSIFQLTEFNFSRKNKAYGLNIDTSTLPLKPREEPP